MRIGEININKAKVVEFIKTNCTEALAAQPIFRGSESTKKLFRVIDTTGLADRKAANTSNYTNLLITGMPAWQVFPRRSTICSTDPQYASRYGTLYRVLPVNGTQIGICPGEDFWGFPALRAASKDITGSTSLPFNIKHLNMELADAAHRCGIDLSETDASALEGQLKQISKIWSRKFMVKRLLGAVIGSESSLPMRLNKLLDPNANGFTISPIASLNATKKEVWFDGKALLVNESVWDQLQLD